MTRENPPEGIESLPGEALAARRNRSPMSAVRQCDQWSERDMRSAGQPLEGEAGEKT